ncbi:hypothetical protein STEG23_027312 [Scotinomys teguina]
MFCGFQAKIKKPHCFVASDDNSMFQDCQTLLLKGKATFFKECRKSTTLEPGFVHREFWRTPTQTITGEIRRKQCTYSPKAELKLDSELRLQSNKRILVECDDDYAPVYTEYDDDYAPVYTECDDDYAPVYTECDDDYAPVYTECDDDYAPAYTQCDDDYAPAYTEYDDDYASVYTEYAI